jgi:hypothetical protein
VSGRPVCYEISNFKFQIKEFLKMATLFEQRKKMAELRERRKSEGTCTECGIRKATTNKDGSPSVRCTECREKDRMNNFSGRPRVISDFDAVDTDYRDTPEFKKYVRAIDGLFTKHGTVTTRLIHESLGYERQSWTLTAIGYIDRIEEVGAQPTRYRKYGSAVSLMAAYMCKACLPNSN